MAGNKTHRIGDHEAAQVRGLTARFEDIDGLETRYYSVGSGNPIVLCHGGDWGRPSSANTWALNIPGLSDKFHVLALDRVACGLTEGPTDREDFIYRTEVEHLREFIRTMGHERVHLIGQSRGAGVAGRLAIEYPEVVETLVIVNTGTLAHRLGGDILHRRDRLLEDIPDEPFGESYRRRMMKLSYTTDHITDEYVRAAGYMHEYITEQEYWDILQSGGLDSYVETLEAAAERSIRQIRGGDLSTPTMLVWGRNDPTATLEQGLMLYDQIGQHNPATRMYIVNKAGHAPYREYPTEFNRVVTQFIDHWRG